MLYFSCKVVQFQLLEIAGGGISDPGEDITDPDNDNNDKNDDDKDAEQDATITFTVKQLMLSHGGASYSSTNSGWDDYLFYLTWHEGDGGWGNGDAKTWGNALTTGGSNVTGGGKNDTYANNLIYAYYYWTGIAQRQAKIVITWDDSSGWALWDFSSNTSTPTTRDTATTYYFWGSGSYSTSIGSKTGTSMSGTWYVHYRQIYTVSFDLDGGSGSFSNRTWYHGITATLPSGSPTKTGYTFAGWNLNGKIYGSGATVSASEVDYYTAAPKARATWTANTYTVSFASNGGSGTMSNMTATYDSNFSVTNSYSRTGYTFAGWVITGCDTNTHYYGTSATDQLVTTDTEITTAITGTGYYKNLTATSGGKVTFTARWSVNTYTLTIKYNVFSGNNDTSLSITQSSSTVSASSIGVKSIATVKHTYQTSALSVTLARVSTSYSYYISVGNAPTKSSSLNSATYSWTPTADETITIYVYQRYMITYSSNNGTGTTPSTQYKIDGTNETIATNSLTRTSYSANGWNTAADRTGTSYASGATYSTESNLTLYANWSATTVSVSVRVKTSNDGTTFANSIGGGTATITYKGDSANSITTYTKEVDTSTLTSVSAMVSQTVTITGTAKDGYVFAGVSTSSSTALPGNGDAFTMTPSSGRSYSYYVYFVKKSGNQLKYQDKYDVTDIDATDNYGFVKNSNGYWESQNKFVVNSYSLAKVEFTLKSAGSVTFQLINYAEANYDFGIFSNVDTTLESSNTADSTNVFKSYKGSSSSSVVTLTYSGLSAGKHYIYVKYRKDGSGNSGNDSLQFKLTSDLFFNGGYFYFEDGEYPQTYVGDAMNTTLINNVSTISSYLYYNNGDGVLCSIPIYTYNNQKYAMIYSERTMTITLNDGSSKTFEEDGRYFFAVEPIRWRVSDYGVESTAENWGVYGTYKTSFSAVSDKILYFDTVELNAPTEGWGFLQSGLYKHVSGTSSSANSFINPTYKLTASKSYNYDYYGPAGQQNKVMTKTNSEAVIRVASIDEIQQDLTDMRATASDMVCVVLGISSDKYCDYWTRNLGTYLRNGKMITSYGMEKSTWLDKLGGVRLSMTFAEGSRTI